MRLEARQRIVVWTGGVLLSLAVVAYVTRTKRPADYDAGLPDQPNSVGPCDGCRSERGELILAGAQTLDRLDPATGESVRFKEYRSPYLVGDPAFIARDSLLVEGCDVVDGCAIRLLNPITGTDTILIDDVYNPAVDTVTRSLYFFAGRSRQRTGLFIAPLDHPAQRSQIAERVLDTLPPHLAFDKDLTPVVLPDGSGILYVGTGDSLTRYDVHSKRSRALPIVDCIPVLVRTRTGELLCADYPRGLWYLLALDHGTRTLLPGATNAYSAAYDQHADVLYLGVSGGFIPERTDVYRLPLGARSRRKRVAKGVYFTSGAWVPRNALGSTKR